MKKLLFVTVFLLIAGSMAGADILNLTGLPAFTYNGVYVGPATGNLDGVTPLTVVCNDYVDTTYIPSSFTVNISTIPSLTYAMYAQPWSLEALTNYQRAAMLLYQMNQPANQSSSGIGDLNFAIWNVFNPAVPDTAGSNGWVAWAQNQDPSAWNYADIRIFTDTNTVDPHNQEFMGGSASQVPEPGTGILAAIGGGLIALGAVRRPVRKKK